MLGLNEDADWTKLRDDRSSPISFRRFGAAALPRALKFSSECPWALATPRFFASFTLAPQSQKGPHLANVLDRREVLLQESFSDVRHPPS